VIQLIEKEMTPLFNSVFNNSNLVNNLVLKLSDQSNFPIKIKDVEEVLSIRTDILLENQLIDFSTVQLLNWAELTLNNSALKKKEWINQMSQFFEIFYELRKNTPSFIEDEVIFEKIKIKYNYYDQDLNLVAGFFETNFNLEGDDIE